MLFRKKKKQVGLSKIIVDKKSSGKSVEGYNRLRDNILYMNVDGNTKVIQIESAVSAEGKTTVACNLAVSLGQAGKKVVVVDLDFHRPHVHRLFEEEKENGIAEYMLDTISFDAIIRATKYENVSIITRGAEIYNTSTVFVSEKFKTLIEELKNKYDYVILDCPPVLQISDYIHISKVSDGVLFMVHYASTTKNQVAEAVKELKNCGANLLGTVFTMYDRKKDGETDNYHYYYYYNNYSNRAPEEEKEEPSAN